MERKYGAFCNIFGATPRIKIIEFFLEKRGLDFGIGDLSKDTGLNRATTYNVMSGLIKSKIIVPSRKVSGGRLYKLNSENKDVKLLVDVFNKILERIVNKYDKGKIKEKVYA